jgi:hypothetical protein
VRTRYSIAQSFNQNVPVGVGVSSGRNLAPGICFGASAVWCKSVLDLEPTQGSSATLFDGMVEKCRRIQFAYEKWGLSEGSKHERRTLQALEAAGLEALLGPDGRQEAFQFDRDFGVMADKLVGPSGRDGTFLFRIAGTVGLTARGAHWMAYRRATRGNDVVRIEFFDANRFCLENSANESLAAVATEITNYLKWAYNGGNGEERFTDDCVLFAVGSPKAVKIGAF